MKISGYFCATALNQKRPNISWVMHPKIFPLKKCAASVSCAGQLNSASKKAKVKSVWTIMSTDHGQPGIDIWPLYLSRSYSCWGSGILLKKSPRINIAAGLLAFESSTSNETFWQRARNKNNQILSSAKLYRLQITQKKEKSRTSKSCAVVLITINR